MATIPDGMFTDDIIDSMVSDMFNDPRTVNTSPLTWDGSPEGAVQAKIWMTNDGRVLSIKDMDSSHITNVIQWILRNRSENLDEHYYIETMKNLREELKSRQT